MAGVPPRVIQEWAGHASIQTTMRYMHFVPAHADDMIRALKSRATGVARKPASEKIDTEPGEIVRLGVVTPKGLEPLFSA